MKISQETVNEFLDNLRESGKTNMFGAGAYLEEFYGLPKLEARAMLAEWMRTFAARHGK